MRTSSLSGFHFPGMRPSAAPWGDSIPGGSWVYVAPGRGRPRPGETAGSGRAARPQLGGGAGPAWSAHQQGRLARRDEALGPVRAEGGAGLRKVESAEQIAPEVTVLASGLDVFGRTLPTRQNRLPSRPSPLGRSLVTFSLTRRTGATGSAVIQARHGPGFRGDLANRSFFARAPFPSPRSLRGGGPAGP